MSTYQYTPLTDPKRDIRLLNLLAGLANDALTATITHVSIVRPQEQAAPRQSLSEIESTLPPFYEAHQTREGLYLIWDPVMGTTSWHHPVTGEDLRESFVDFPPPGYEPRYEALSYTWEREPPSVPLIIFQAGQSPSELETGNLPRLLISPNLSKALHRLRKADEDVPLWVDAVCINQHDTLERNLQVQRMTDVYSLAYRVNMWLGDGDVSSERAMRTLARAGAQVELFTTDKIAPSPEAEEPDFYTTDSNSPLSAEDWSGILAFLKRSYFGRLWIVQEVQLANRRAVLYCGKDSLSWPRVRRALLCLASRIVLPAGEAYDLLRELGGLLYDQRAKSLWSLLVANAYRRCTQHHDRIYGVLGLCNGRFAGTMDPDYAISPAEVYRRAFFACLQYDDRLEILHCCQNGEQNVQGCPSWVPDWSVSRFMLALQDHNASGTSRAHWRHIEPHAFHVKGVRCATVRQVGNLAPLNDHEKLVETIRGWEPKGLRTEIYINGENLLTVFTSTICGNRLKNRFPTRPYPYLLDWTQEYLSELSDPVEGLDIDALDKTDLFLRLEPCLGRRFLITDGGYIGLAPKAAEPGDIVCTILGLSAPVLLRPSSERPDAFTIVGCAYVHGLEDAIAFLGPLPKPWAVQFHSGKAPTDPTNTTLMPYYFNERTFQYQLEDPRLPSFEDDQDWIRMPFERKRDDPDYSDIFRHALTGEMRNSDPRLDPEALETRGVAIEEFMLV